MKKIILIFILLISFIVSLFVGLEKISLENVVNPQALDHTLFFSTRLPRSISLVVSGAVLSVSGLLMQQLTQNKFVSPTTAGTMDSARLGILVAMLFFANASVFQKTFLAFSFALGGTLLFTTILKRIRLQNSVMVPLIGMMLGNIIGSIATYLAYQNDLIQNISSWMQGNFSLVSSNNYQLIYFSIPVLIVIYIFAHHFTLVSMGKELTTNLGLSYEKVQTLGVVCVALASSAVILTVGNIPFLGIIIPNLISLKLGDHFKKILFPTAVFGAIFLVNADILSRLLIYPYEVPVSLVAGIIGGAIFLYLLLKGEQ